MESRLFIFSKVELIILLRFFSDPISVTFGWAEKVAQMRIMEKNMKR